MSNQLTQTRQGIVANLVAAGFNAFDHFPERVTAPFAFVGPGDPYVHYGETGETPFGKEIVDHVVVLVAAKGTNQASIDALDEMIADALRALDYKVDQVDQPGMINISGIGDCYASALPIRHHIALK